MHHRQDHAVLLLRYGPQYPHDLQLVLHVQGRCGLVEKEYPRLLHQGAGQGDLLALTAAELVEHGVRELGHLHVVHAPLYDLRILLFEAPVDVRASPEGDEFPHRQRKGQRGALGHVGLYPGDLLEGAVEEVPPVEEGLPGIGSEEVREATEEGGLADAVRSRYRGDVARRCRGGHVVEDHLLSVGERDVLDIEIQIDPSTAASSSWSG